MTDKTARQTALDAAEANGTRVKPEYGSVWYDMNGPDNEHARIHVTIAVPGATYPVHWLHDTPNTGWRVDYERGHLDRPHHDAKQLTMT